MPCPWLVGVVDMLAAGATLGHIYKDGGLESHVHALCWSSRTTPTPSVRGPSASFDVAVCVEPGQDVGFPQLPHLDFSTPHACAVSSGHDSPYLDRGDGLRAACDLDDPTRRARALARLGAQQYDWSLTKTNLLTMQHRRMVLSAADSIDVVAPRACPLRRVDPALCSGDCVPGLSCAPGEDDHPNTAFPLPATGEACNAAGRPHAAVRVRSLLDAQGAAILEALEGIPWAAPDNIDGAPGNRRLAHPDPLPSTGRTASIAAVHTAMRDFIGNASAMTVPKLILSRRPSESTSRSAPPPVLFWHPPMMLLPVRPPPPDGPLLEEVIAGPFTMMEWDACEHWHGGSVPFSSAGDRPSAPSGAVFVATAPEREDGGRRTKVTMSNLRAFDANTSVSPHHTIEADHVMWWIARAGMWRLASFGGEVGRVGWTIGVLGGRLWYRPLLHSEFGDSDDPQGAACTAADCRAYLTAARAAHAAASAPVIDVG